MRALTISLAALALATVASAQPRPTVPADASARELLGARRADVEATHPPSATEPGWTRYGDALAIAYDLDVATRVRVRVAATSCDEAARLGGFAPVPGTAPLRRADGCEWPGMSDRHRLAPHVAARFAGGWLEVWRSD